MTKLNYLHIDFKYILFFILFFFTSLNADTVSFSFENDAFVNDDSGYTSGTKVAWLGNQIDSNSSNNGYGVLMQNIVESIPFHTLDDSKKHNAGIALYQMIFTPDDLSEKRPLYDDIPYSGTLLLSFFLFEWDKKSYHEFYIDTGIVGPNAYGEEIQKPFHKMIGTTNPKGWDNQLDNQIMFDIAYGYGNRTWERSFENSLKMDWINAFRAQLGNFYTGASFNTMIRVGKNYPENFNMNAPGSLSNSDLLNQERKDKNFGWALSAGAQTDGVSYLYVIDSAKEYEIDRKKFSVSLIGAINLYYDETEVSLSICRRTSLTKHDSADTSSFGSLSFLFHF